MADCGLPQLLIGQAIIPVIGCIRIGVIERPELVIGKCLIRSIGIFYFLNRNSVNALNINSARFSTTFFNHFHFKDERDLEILFIHNATRVCEFHYAYNNQNDFKSKEAGQ